MAQGKTTEVDNALISRSSGAVTLLTAVEGNNKALESIKDRASVELRDTSQMQNEQFGDGALFVQYQNTARVRNSIV